MGRVVLGLDRFAGVLLGLALVAGGAFAFGWRHDLIPDVPDRLTVPELAELPSADWWPWATTGAGLLLVGLGLLWLLRHLPRRIGADATLAGSGRPGRLAVDLRAATDTAAKVLRDGPGVRSATGRPVRDRGQLVAEFVVTIEPTADLAEVATAARQVADQLARTVGRDDLRHRTVLRVARRPRSSPRVE